MKRRPAAVLGAVLVGAGVTSALVGGAQAAAPTPTPEVMAQAPTLQEGQVIDLGGGMTAGSEVVPLDELPLSTQQTIRAAALATSDPECYPNSPGEQVHIDWIRYQFDSGQVPGPTAGSVRIDSVTHDDCYQITGELRGPGLSKLMQADLTVVGQTEFNQPYFPADGVYEWHKYKSDQSTIAYPHGMHSFKRTVIFDFKSDNGPSPFSHHVTMGLDTYAGLNDYLCWFRDDVDDNGNINRERGEGCFYVA